MMPVISQLHDVVANVLFLLLRDGSSTLVPEMQPECCKASGHALVGTAGGPHLLRKQKTAARKCKKGCWSVYQATNKGQQLEKSKREGSRKTKWQLSGAAG